MFYWKNDHGKSTILEGLNAFFNDIFDKSDFSIDAIDDAVSITCVFTNVPSKVILDTTIETSLEEECLLNSDGYLEIIKIFKVGGTVSKSTYLKAYYPTHPDLDNLLLLNNTGLKNLAKTLEIDLKGVAKTKNPPIRRMIRDSRPSEKLHKLLKVDGSLDGDNNLKAIYAKLKLILPVFTLFKVDKNLDDKDKDVQDPMKVAVKESLASPEIKSMLEEIENKIKLKCTEVADRTIEKLKEIDASLAEKMKSDFGKQPAWSNIFDLTLLNDKNIPLNKRGSGVKRLVLLSFFQAQAEKRKIEENAPSIIYAIEEPETSQHPDHQKILIQSLIDLSERENIQVLFTTHSSNLAREIPIESLVYVYKVLDSDITNIKYGYDKHADLTNDEVLNKIISSLGVLPNPNDHVKLLLFVEGIHDISALIRYSKIFNAHNLIYENIENNIKIGIVISGGSTLKYYIENKYLDGLGKPELHIYDNDVLEYRQLVKKMQDENNKNRRAYNTSKLMMENYLHHKAIEEAYADNNIFFNMEGITDDMNVPEVVAKIVYETSTGLIWSDLDEYIKKKKKANVKKMLNNQAVDKMTIERLHERSAFEDIDNWFKTISEFNN